MSDRRDRTLRAEVVEIRMDSFAMPLPKLLYLVYEMHGKGLLTVADKERLKGETYPAMIVTEDEQILSLLDDYTETNDREGLERNILRLLKTQPRAKPPSPVSIPKRDFVAPPAPAEEEEAETSSPLGTFLHERKKHQHGEMELHLNLCEPTQAPDDQLEAIETS